MCGRDHVPLTPPRLACSVTSGEQELLRVAVSTCGQRGRDHDAHLYVAIDGELDAFTGEQVSGAIGDIVAGASGVVIDMSDLHFVDSGGLELVAAIEESATARDGTVWLHDPGPAVRRMLRLHPRLESRVCSPTSPSGVGLSG